MSIVNQHDDMTRLCVGCGVCIGLCPTGAIKLNTTETALTVVFDSKHCIECGKCNKACPSLLASQGRDLGIGKIHGNVEKVYCGYGEDKDIHYHGASGGIVTSLIIRMLEYELDKVLVVKMLGFKVEPLLTNNTKDIISAQGSIYFKTFSLTVLQELLHLLREKKRIGIIALPCQISALKKILKDFDDQIYFVGLMCNHTNEIWYLKDIVKKYSPKKIIPIGIGSRKNGWPGKTELLFRAVDNFKVSIPQSIFWGIIPSLGISSPLGCMLCQDHLASDADIVMGDAWHPKFTKTSSSGTSIVIARNTKSVKLLNEAVKDRILNLEEISLLELNEMTNNHVLEASRYAPFRKKLFQHNFAVLRELKDLDKLIVCLLYGINGTALRCKAFRFFLGTRLAEKSLKIILHGYLCCKRTYLRSGDTL